MRRQVIDDSVAVVAPAPEKAHAMQSEQIREARPGRKEACYDCPLWRSQFAVLSENFKCLHLPFVELHCLFDLPILTGLFQLVSDKSRTFPSAHSCAARDCDSQTRPVLCTFAGVETGDLHVL